MSANPQIYRKQLNFGVEISRRHVFATKLALILLVLALNGCAGVVSANKSAPTAPAITAQPSSQSVTVGQTATFSVLANGTVPLSYQWQKNGAIITGATLASYATPPTTSADNGATFMVVVSNSAGSASSNPATLTVNPTGTTPAITAEPANQTVSVGQTATFSVVATGTAPLNYQWQKNGASIAGATSATYTTPATTSADSGSTFQVVVSNSAGNAHSNLAILTVNAAAVAPTITTQPVNQTVTAGQTATFAVVATGTAPLSYQWQKNGAAISGANSESYTTPATGTADNGSKFAVVVSNSAGNVTSSSATLTVNPAPVAPSITTQPASVTVTAGQTATFSVVASGTAPLSYQWQKNGTVISGATGTSYTTPATITTDNNSTFAVVVSNSAGSITSSSATLTVNAALVAPSITRQPVSVTVTAGQTATFSVVATGTAPLSYQWQKGGTDIGGATASSYTTPATAASDNGETFQVVVTNSVGSVTSNSALLTVTTGSTVATVTIDAATPSLTIPANFMGLSADVFQVQGWIGSASNPNTVYEQLLKNLMLPGQGLVFNAEGDASSETTPPPSSDVLAFAKIYQDTGMKFFLPADLAANNSSLAAREATVYVQNMPTGSLLGITIGNEPDDYQFNGIRSPSYTYADFVAQWRQWQSAINAASVAPNVKFLGPSFGGQLPWVWTGTELTPFINSEASTLTVASQHWYAGIGCAGATNPANFLLQPSAATSASSILGTQVAAAHANGLTFRMSEMNSIDCGGEDGVSDIFASALWVADALFNLAKTGVDGVNIFSGGSAYDPFITTAGNPSTLNSVRPEYYGMLLFQQATQNGGRLLPVTLRTSANLTAWSTIDSTGVVRVLIINKDLSANGTVAVSLSAFGPATTTTLTAPSYTSKTGVTLGGQTFDGSHDGKIQGTPLSSDVTPANGIYTVQISSASATLLTIAP